MKITVVTPEFYDDEKYTTEERRKNFSKFYDLANEHHHHRTIKYDGNEYIDNEEDLHWKDELVAVIEPKDFVKFEDAVAFVCGSPLEITKEISKRRVLVHASGYWRCVGT